MKFKRNGFALLQKVSRVVTCKYTLNIVTFQWKFRRSYATKEVLSLMFEQPFLY